MRRFSPALLTAVAAFLFASSTASAATKSVDSITALQSALNESVAGDIFILNDGVYPTTQPIILNRPGSAEQPIVVTVKNVGAAEITGTHGFVVTGSAAYVTISGFKFTHAAGTALIDEGTSHIRFTRNSFLCSGDGADLSISGDDAQIDYNEFGAKKTAGNMIAVAGTGTQVSRRLWIHHNYFHDLTNSGREGAQMLRLGLMGTQGQSIGAALVENNLFADCRGVTEMISSRSSGNTFRYNTFIDSPTAQLTLRRGNDCIVYGNYFRNTEGIRIYGSRHQIFSNYFERNHIAIAIGNGAPDPTDGTANKNAHPDECVVAFNTFVNNSTHYLMSRRAPVGLGATHTTFANNIVVGGDTVAKIGGPYADAAWSGNLLWNFQKFGDIPPEGFTQVDPLLAAGPDGIQRPQAGSPAFGAAVGAFPAVTVDFDGQPRPGKKSIGASESSTAPTTPHFISVAEVGPTGNEPKPTPPPAPAPSLSTPAPVRALARPAPNIALPAVGKPATPPRAKTTPPASTPPPKTDDAPLSDEDAKRSA
ncbi:MAG: polysaccharide lyase 6 family protein [Lacunisphaera sp.]